MTVGDVTGPLGRLGFAPKEGESLESLRLRADLDDTTVTELGFTDVTDDGGITQNPLESARQAIDLVARSHSDTFFLFDSGLDASVTLQNTADVLGFEIGQGSPPGSGTYSRWATRSTSP